MDNALLLRLIQIIIAIILVFSILLQVGEAGFSSPFGRGGESFRTRRGVEKALFYLTLVAGVLFVLVTIVGLLVLE
jgi:protein translocase SecG subunit